MRKKDVLLDEQLFLVVDCETTGLNPEKDKLLSIAVVPVRDSAVHLGEVSEWTVAQENATLAGSAPVHGIMPEAVAKGTPEHEVTKELLKMEKKGIWVGHHITFDMAVIRNACLSQWQQEFSPPFLDTGQVFNRLENPGRTIEPIDLDTLAENMGIAPAGRHTAGGDALTTAMIFIKLLHRAKRKGIKTVKSLQKRGGNPFFRF